MRCSRKAHRGLRRDLPLPGIDSGQRWVSIRVVTKAWKGIAVRGTRQILFIQGGGAGAHDEWDDKLVESLRRGLGGEHEVRYPRMPDEGDPSYARWSAAIRREMAALDDGAVVVGHSVGAAILLHALAEQPPDSRLGAIGLIAAPFSAEGGWPSDEFELTSEPAPSCRRMRGCMCSTGSGMRRPRPRMPSCMPWRSRRRRCTSCPGGIIS